MRIRPSVALAFGVGYLFGTRAGRESYEEIARQSRLVWDRPEVQSVAGIVSAQVGGVYRRARSTLGGNGAKGHGDGPGRAADRFAPAGGAAPKRNGFDASTTP